MFIFIKMNDKTAHCRLCGNIKSYNKLIDLHTTKDGGLKVFEQLSRLNVYVTNLDLPNDELPKTICFLCNDSLNKAFDFVLCIEAAQSELGNFLDSHIKLEDFDNCVTFNELEVKVVKEVDEAIKIENGYDQVSNCCTNRSGSNIKTLERSKALFDHHDDKSDELPLSQLKLSWLDYSWKCSYCDTQFPNIEELKTHSKQYHSCCNAYRCLDCNIRKLKLDKFVTHVRRHRKYLKLSCYLCHIKFRKPYDAITHKKIHLTSEFRCLGCNETFSTSEELFEHNSTYNKDRKTRDLPKERLPDNLTCTVCNKTFTSKGYLSQHILTHTNRKRDHTCEICGKCFYNKYGLADHLNMHKDTRPHQCKICKHSFRTRSQLRTHIGVHNGEKPFACEQCGRCFRLEKQLLSHSIVHTDSMPYVCTICKKGFRFRNPLKIHTLQHTGIKPYSCQICLKHFTNWSNYSKHMKRLHSTDVAKKKLTAVPQTKKNIEWMKKVLEENRYTKRKVVEAKIVKESDISGDEIES